MEFLQMSNGLVHCTPPKDPWIPKFFTHLFNRDSNKIVLFSHIGKEDV